MKILSIGNSFSQDAQRWLHAVAQADGGNLDTVNLYIGGCSLERHWDNVLSRVEDYDMEGNDGIFIRKISLNETLESDRYDVVTLQQVSGQSGRPQSYFPYVTDLADTVRKNQPGAQLFFHRTWSYETDSSHPDFAYYNNDRKEMYWRIRDATEMAAKVINARIIPTGDVIETLCGNAEEFNCKKGISLYRDGFHLSLDYGRLTAALVWYKTLTGRLPESKSVSKISGEFDVGLVDVISEYIKKEVG